MPPVRSLTPASLEDLCHNTLFSHLEREVMLIHQIRTFQSTSLLLRNHDIDADSLLEELSMQLAILPPLLSEIVRQNITIRLLKGSSKTGNNNPAIIIELLDIILNKEIRTLQMSDHNLSHSSPIWPLILQKCTGLQSFGLTTNLIEAKNMSRFQGYLVSLVSNCPTLTELILKDSVEGPEALAAIGQCCPRLRVLDLVGSQVGCNDMVSLCVKPAYAGWSIDTILDYVGSELRNPLCKSMQRLLLGNTLVKVKGAALVLKLLPNVVSLGNFVFTAAGLKRIYGSKLRLKHSRAMRLQHVFYRGPSSIKLKVIANCCPALEILFIGSEFIRRINFSNWSPFSKLRSLTLENIHPDDIATGLKHMRSLTELQLASGGVDLSVVAQSCPYLEKLWISAEPLRVCRVALNWPVFSELRDVKISCTVSLDCAELLVTQSLKLRSLEIVRIRDLTDQIFANWLRLNPLDNLETLMLRYVGLTRESVNLLLAGCPKLTRLGYLGSWDIRSWECRRLKDRVLRENLALHLVLYSRSSLTISSILTENVSSDDDDFQGGLFN